MDGWERRRTDLLDYMRGLLFTPVGRIFMGQFLAFLMSCTGVFTTLLVNNGASFPLLQSIMAYTVIVAVFLPIYLSVCLRKEGNNWCMQAARGSSSGATLVRDCGENLVFSNFVVGDRLWRYFIIAVADLEANYLVVKAYQYTNMTSVQLLDCFTIPCVMLLSLVVLAMRFSAWQIGGVIVAILGIVLLIVLDADGLTRTSEAPNVVLGDLLCLASSVCYAISNVACEKLIKVPTDPQQQQDGADNTNNNNNNGYNPEALPPVPAWLPVLEYLAIMPSFALILGIVQFFLLEFSDLRAYSSAWTAVDTIYLVSFAFSMVFVYGGMPLIFYISSATFANLSLLSSDVYSIIFNVTVFSTNPKPTFFLAYVVIVAGITAYDTDGFKFLRDRYRLLRYNSL